MKKQQYSDRASLPIDLAFEIASSLEAEDACSLGSSCKFWKQICGSDWLWESLFKRRWPAVSLDISMSMSNSTQSEFDQQKDCIILNKGWKEIYSKKHIKMEERMGCYKKWLESEYVVGIEDYLKVIGDMKIMQFGFNDVIIFFFKSNNSNVFLNLLGLHYSIKHLNIQVEEVIDAISVSNIEDKKVCIRWRRKGGWMHRFPLPDQLHRRCLSLKELLLMITMEGSTEALDVLDHGLTEVVVQIHISSSIPECSVMGERGEEVGGCEFTYILPY